MALSRTYRWILVGNIKIKNEAKIPDHFPEFSLKKVMKIATKRSDNEDYKEYGLDKNKRRMWLSNHIKDDEYYQFLMEISDQNATGTSYYNFKTKAGRDVRKDDDEGSYYASHILIKKNPDEHGHHLILIEKVPGITLSSVQSYFRWMCQDEKYFKEHTCEESGETLSYRALFDIDGHQSSTIRQALETGKLQDIEFIGHEKIEDEHDEDPYTNEIVHKTQWVVKKEISADGAEGLFKRGKKYISDTFSKSVTDPEMHVRIKTDTGQVKTTEIQIDENEILEQAFIRNEKIQSFDTELPQRHTKLRKDVLFKMKKIINDKILSSKS